ncbi:MAG: hypothetical protein ACYC0X_05425 [Pirellulaceae bacterium]
MPESQHFFSTGCLFAGRRGRTLARGLLAAGWVAFLSGCGSGESVRHYRVPTRELVYAENHVKRSAESEEASAPAQQATEALLGAIVPHGTQTWYFKMMGPVHAVARQSDAFRGWIESLRFENEQGRPQWTLPESWQEKESTGERGATLSVDVDGQSLEVSVIPLTTGASVDSLLDNINRWRAQMQLPPLTAEQLPAETMTLELPAGQATLVSLVGNFRSGGMGSTARQLGSSTSAASGESAGSVPQYTQPDTWVVAATDAFSQQAFSVSDGAATARITISQLRGDGGGLLENVNRWRRQVGLPDAVESELAAVTEEFPIDGTRGVYLECAGNNEQGQPEAVYGWIGLQEDRSWFIKIRGEAQLVSDQRETFRTFLKSLKLSASNGVGNGN